ncbi:MAG: hypothetical protein GTO02_20900, partial [Candidatus Dadabacteria bacterium]|nr:hypothetical protein [Candidatus Dadabacteria bacterium]
MNNENTTITKKFVKETEHYVVNAVHEGEDKSHYEIVNKEWGVVEGTHTLLPHVFRTIEELELLLEHLPEHVESLKQAMSKVQLAPQQPRINKIN